MPNQNQPNKKKLGGILALVTAGLLLGASACDLVNPKVAQVLTAGAATVAAFSQQLGSDRRKERRKI